jgi:hypothetical protein
MTAKPGATPTAEPRARCLLFEALPLLFSADVGDDGVDVLVAQSGDRGHVAEVPVVLRSAIGDSRAERVVGVMVRLVHDRQV